MNDTITPGSFTEPVGRSVSAALGSRTGRWLVYALVFFWTVPTFGLAVSSVRSEIDVKTSGWWRFFLSPSFTLDNYESVLSGRPGQQNLGYFFM
ncbi:MAG: carbohydrate ABC transporter permease, partial [Ilumatobacteraceae bacterium]